MGSLPSAPDFRVQVRSIASAPIYLTGREYSILELLALRKGNTLTKDMIMSHLYGGMDVSVRGTCPI